MFIAHNSFGVWDYVVFSAMLFVSLAIGVWFAVRGGGQKTQGEYLMGNRNMSVLPVAISILVSFMSAILILGTPAEMYTQGTEYIVTLIGLCMGIILASLLFVPLLYPLKLTSVYEYLEVRFNSRCARLVGTCIMVITQIIYMGIASFAPATAFQVGIPVWATILTTGAIATIYTTVGGIKAVIWTDVFQSVVMLAGIMTIVIQGTLKVGSLSKVWDINNQCFEPDPRIRHTFWGMIIGPTFGWIGTYGVSQPSAQRYCTLPTLRKAKMSIVLNIIGVTVLLILTCLSGIVLFAYYAAQNCNPVGQKLVSSPNQLVPYFVMETLGYPGVPGLFIACLFSGSLSSVSSSLNALGAITWEDFLKPRYDQRLTESQKTLVTKLSVFIYGIFAIGFSLTAERLEGTVLQASSSLTGAAGGPLTGMFILGAFFPWANSYGAVSGAVVGLGLSFWMAFGAYINGIRLPPKPFPSGTCHISSNINSSSSHMTTTLSTLTSSTAMSNLTMDIKTLGVAPSRTGLDGFYAISYLYFPVVGVLSCVVVGLLVSFITGPNKIADVPAKYQIPVASRLCCCLPRSWQHWLNCNREFQEAEKIYSEEKDIEMVIGPPEINGSSELVSTADRSSDIGFAKSSQDSFSDCEASIEGYRVVDTSVNNPSRDLEPMLVIQDSTDTDRRANVAQESLQAQPAVYESSLSVVVPEVSYISFTVQRRSRLEPLSLYTVVTLDLTHKMFVAHNSFGVWDYVVFSAMLFVSLAIGVWFAVRGGGQKTQGEYLMGNRSMSVLPVAISIMVSFLSAIMILGIPAEMYTQGTEYVVTVFGISIGIIGATLLFVPLMYPLKLTSVFEYLELRFDSRNVRLVGTCIMILSQITYMGFASFAPAIAFQLVSGIPVWATNVGIGAIATIYTTIGGLKAVVWTDVFQSLVMLAGILAIVIQGTLKVGSLSAVWDINDKWERIAFFNFDPDPRVRQTVWNMIIGQAFIWFGAYGIGQPSVQRYCSLPSLREAK
ncbi:Sodium-coupled monocarboxylate transporter 1, partial [Bulinus truncatus]